MKIVEKEVAEYRDFNSNQKDLFKHVYNITNNHYIMRGHP